MATVMHDTAAAAVRMNYSSVDVSHGITPATPTSPSPSMRVMFVPIDPNRTLTSQHGGRFNCILHKLTEDILTLSKSAQDSSSPQAVLEAQRRVGGLEDYARLHKYCKLIDPPRNVSRLMNRGIIAATLSSSLPHVLCDEHTRVRTPSYVIVSLRPAEGMLGGIEEEIGEKGMEYPLIVKNLDAAGTVESHQMLIAMDATALRAITGPCLIQAYENHDGRLFKVYVLGSTVRVFARPSLPNLPAGGTGSFGRSFVKFDSQQPYPSLEEFGITTASAVSEDDRSDEGSDDGGMVNMVGNIWDNHESAGCATQPAAHAHEASSLGSECGSEDSFEVKGFGMLTIKDVAPIAKNLSETFGLDLFGFDLLVSGGGGEKDLVVVDVNYFPGYKELQEQFPTMLAEYLIKHAVMAASEEYK